jgi:hypothetical protein
LNKIAEIEELKQLIAELNEIQKHPYYNTRISKWEEKALNFFAEETERESNYCKQLLNI